MRAILRCCVGRLFPRGPVKKAIRGRLSAGFHGKPGRDFEFKTFDKGSGFLVSDTPVIFPTPYSNKWLLDHPEDILELQVFSRVAREADGALFDIGAHIGTFAVLFCKLSRHDAATFEPHPDASDKIHRVAALNDVHPNRIRVLQAAVGSEVGMTNMHLDEISGFAQVQKYDSSRARADASIDVPLTTVDKTRSELGVKVGLLKIDVEGFEDEVLKGAGETIARDRPVISLELHSDYLRERGSDSRAIVAELLEKGYSLMRLNGRPVKTGTVFTFVSRAHLLAVPQEDRLRYQRILAGKT